MIKAALVVWSDGQGDMAVYLVTPELYAQMVEAAQPFELLTLSNADGYIPNPGVLKRVACQNGVPEPADFSGFSISGVYVDEVA